jgi:hypothetical protein
MARHLPILNGAAAQQSAATRSSHVRRGVWIELVTILWMTIVIIAASAARSVALARFGLDSFIEIFASADVKAKA